MSLPAARGAGTIAERVAAVRERIAAAARRAGRDPASVRLVAVTKTVPPEAVREAFEAGCRTFGENRVQEAERKMEALARMLGPEADTIEWRLVGRLQRNKARRAAARFRAIESVDRPALALALERAAAELGRTLPVLVEVNLDGEPQKGGVPPEALGELVACVDAQPHLVLEGLMAIPAPRESAEAMRPAFRRLRELRDALDRRRPPERRLRELSMGMSRDFEVAIEEGATIVRVGTAIFGERPR